MCSLVQLIVMNKEVELEGSGWGQNGRRAVEMAEVGILVLNDRCL